MTFCWKASLWLTLLGYAKFLICMALNDIRDWCSLQNQRVEVSSFSFIVLISLHHFIWLVKNEAKYLRWMSPRWGMDWNGHPWNMLFHANTIHIIGSILKKILLMKVGYRKICCSFQSILKWWMDMLLLCLFSNLGSRTNSIRFY